ncbi:exonuclease domain-containing protein [Chenggangzhangella methanolivorans]|uniref:exonuclease domain-containing protein n=1 Tax=Chenggangzhangella methanolivorans TaxID=1437009 RepID=UPI003D17546D
MREIVLDTETTGLDPATGDRVVEIGCVELLNRIPTGTSYHVYINPERSMPEEAFRVHGLSSEFLSDKPRFAEIADEFLTFIDEDALVIHNAAFDVGFLDAEFAKLGKPKISRSRVVDTLMLARRKNRAARPRSTRALRALRHRQLQAHQARRAARFGDPGRGLSRAARRPAGLSRPVATLRPGREGRLCGGPAPDAASARLTDAEVEAHLAFVAGLGGTVLWREFLAEPDAVQPG